MMESCTENDKIVEEILTNMQLDYIKAQVSKPGSQIVGYSIRPATELGIAGFLGDHFRMTLSIKENKFVRQIYLFIKSLPMLNKPKADFICQNQLFKKEAMFFKMLEEIQELDYLKPWSTKALVHDDKVIVMPDLSMQGYKTHPTGEVFDQNHVFTAVTSLARFHAAFANYFTTVMNKSPEKFADDYRLIIEETFWENRFLRAAAKLTNNFLREFSSLKNYPADLEDKLCKLYVKAYCEPTNTEETLNVVIHKDLWANNILFQYTNDVPTNAVLIDFQLIRYAPPAFDLMSLLYLTTSRNFRDCHESEVLQHYYTVFVENLDDLTKARVKSLNYDLKCFLAWCKKARSYGLVQAINIFPYVLMEPATAQKTFDDPDTYIEYLERDRSKPVIAHARECDYYRYMQLEVCEEFLEKYVT